MPIHEHKYPVILRLLTLTPDPRGPEGEDDHGLLPVSGSCGVRLPHEDTELRPETGMLLNLPHC
jgi:hypothetical protein